MTPFRFVSQNTIDHLSLHDCVCSQLTVNSAEIVFEMQWLEVLASHPDNPFPQAHQSGKGRIVLHKPVVKSGELTTGDTQTQIPETAVIKDFEILEFDEQATESGFELSLYGVSVGEPKADFIEMKIAYESSEVMFDELGEASWFEVMAQDMFGALEYSTEDTGVMHYKYKGRTFELTDHPYEPCLYISGAEKIICTLHTAFTTRKLIEAFSKGESVKAIDWKDYDEKAFCKVLAAALDSGRDQLDYTYAAKLAEKSEVK